MKLNLDMHSSITEPENLAGMMGFGTPLDNETIISSQQEDAPILRRSNRQRRPKLKTWEAAQQDDTVLSVMNKVLATYLEPEIVVQTHCVFIKQ